MIGHDNIEIVKLKGITEGAACTALLAKEYIDSENPLFEFGNGLQYAKINKLI